MNDFVDEKSMRFVVELAICAMLRTDVSIEALRHVVVKIFNRLKSFRQRFSPLLELFEGRRCARQSPNVLP